MYDQPLVVEFFGLSGAGKSTICKAVKRHLAGRGLPVVDLATSLGDDQAAWIARHWRRAGYVLYGFMRRPLESVLLVKLVLQDGQTSVRNLMKVCWNFWSILGWYAWLYRRLPPDYIVLVDQGLVQAVWSIRFSARVQQADWAAFLTRCGLSHMMLVALQTPPDVARQRLAARAAGSSRMEAYARDGFQKEWSKAAALFEELSEVLAGVSPAPKTVKIDDDGSRNADMLAQAVLEELPLGTGDISPSVHRHP